jgi:hypothetical protein
MPLSSLAYKSIFLSSMETQITPDRPPQQTNYLAEKSSPPLDISRFADPIGSSPVPTPPTALALKGLCEGLNDEENVPNDNDAAK